MRAGNTLAIGVYNFAGENYAWLKLDIKRFCALANFYSRS